MEPENNSEFPPFYEGAVVDPNTPEPILPEKVTPATVVSDALSEPLEPANFDPTTRTRFPNEDGSERSLVSRSFEIDGKETLIPTVHPETGEVMSDEDAIKYYHKTGQHLGQYPTREEATAAGQQYSENQNLREDTRRAVIRASYSDGDQVAKNAKLARELDAPPGLLPEDAESQAIIKRNSGEGLRLNYPGTSKFIQREGNAEIVGKDLEDMKEFEEMMVSFNKTPPEEVGGFGASVLSMTGQTIAGLGREAADFLGADQDNVVAEFGRQLMKDNPLGIHSLGDIAKDPLLVFREAIGNAAPSMVSIGTSVAAGDGLIRASAFAPHPFAKGMMRALGYALKYGGPVVAVGAPSYEGIRREQIHGDPDNLNDMGSKLIALLGATIVGAIEKSFGPQQWATKLGTKEGWKSLRDMLSSDGVIKTVSRNTIIEGIEEIIQNPIEQLASYQDPLTEENVQETLFGGAMGAMGGAGISAGAVGVNRVAQAREKKRVKEEEEWLNDLYATANAATAKAARAKADRAILGKLSELTPDNPLRKRSDEKFKEFVQVLGEEGAPESLLIDGGVLQEAFNQNGVTPEELKAKAPELFDELQTALSARGEVSIKTSDYLVLFAGTPIEEAIIDDIRVRPDGLTFKESKTVIKEQQELFEQDIARVVAENTPILTREEFDAQQVEVSEPEKEVATEAVEPTAAEAGERDTNKVKKLTESEKLSFMKGMKSTNPDRYNMIIKTLRKQKKKRDPTTFYSHHRFLEDRAERRRKDKLVPRKAVFKPFEDNQVPDYLESKGFKLVDESTGKFQDHYGISKYYSNEKTSVRVSDHSPANTRSDRHRHQFYPGSHYDAEAAFKYIDDVVAGMDPSIERRWGVKQTYEEYLEENDPVAAFNAQVVSLREKIRGELKATGKYSDSVVESSIVPLANFYMVQAAREGVSVEQIYKLNPLKISADGKNVGFSQPTKPAATLDNFKPENLHTLLDSSGWAIITAYSDKNKTDKTGTADEKNEQANIELEEELIARGFEYVNSNGKYKHFSAEPGFTILGITPDEAHALGNKYKQDSVQVPKGFIYYNDVRQIAEHVRVGEASINPEDPYTEIPKTDALFTVDFEKDKNGKDVFRDAEGKVIANPFEETGPGKRSREKDQAKIDADPRMKGGFKEATKRVPTLQGTAALIKPGDTATFTAHQKAINATKPVHPYTSIAPPSTDKAAKAALTKGKGQSKKKADKFGKPRTLKDKHRVGVRLDIPSYTNHGAWVLAVHEDRKGKNVYDADTVIGYDTVAVLEEVSFGLRSDVALKIAQGSAKGTIATMKGKLRKSTPKAAKKLAVDALNDYYDNKQSEWVQVGMDPERHGFFYDRETQSPVVTAEEVIQVGAAVLARNVTYDTTTQLLYQTDIRSGKVSLDKLGLPKLPGKKKYKVRQVAAALQGYHRKLLDKKMKAAAARKGRELTDKESDTVLRNAIVSMMTDEVMFELDAEHNGAGWYTERYENAISIMSQVYPELATNQSARDAFTLLIGITSVGASPDVNLGIATRIYSRFRKGGESEGTFSLAPGKKEKEDEFISKSLKRMNKLLKQKGGLDGMTGYLMREGKLGALKKEFNLKDVSGAGNYGVEAKLPVAALEVGAKVGVFYANLMGKPEYLTMDRWWSRTFNRYRGELLTAPTQQSMDRFKELTNQPGLSNEEVIAAAKPYADAAKAKGFKGMTELETMSNSMWKKVTGTLDAPTGPTDRALMMRAAIGAQQRLARKGKTITIADIQALLWYYEKKLYGELGAQPSKLISFEEAAQAFVDKREAIEEKPENDDYRETTVFNQLRSIGSGLEESFIEENLTSVKNLKVIQMVKNETGGKDEQLNINNLEIWLKKMSEDAQYRHLNIRKSELNATGLLNFLATEKAGYTLKGIFDREASAAKTDANNESIAREKDRLSIQIDKLIAGMTLEAEQALAQAAPKAHKDLTYEPDTTVSDIIKFPRSYENDLLNAGMPEKLLAVLLNPTGVRGTMERYPGGYRNELEDVGATFPYKVSVNDYDYSGVYAAESVHKPRTHIPFDEVRNFIHNKNWSIEENVLGEEGTMGTLEDRIDREMANEDDNPYKVITDTETVPGSTVFRVSLGGHSADVGTSNQNYYENESNALVDARVQWEEKIEAQYADERRTGFPKWSEYRVPGENTNYREMLIRMPVSGEEARFTARGHYDGELGENLLFHLRVDDREGPNGEKILFINEMQSDWAKKVIWKFDEKGSISQIGSRPTDKQIARLRKDLIKVDKKVKDLEERLEKDVIGPDEDAAIGPAVQEQYDKAIILQEKISGQLVTIDHGIVQESAPFIESDKEWVTLAMKLLLRNAVEGGYDSIAWSTGDQQAELWSSAVRREVDEIRWEKTKNGVHIVGVKGVAEDALERHHQVNERMPEDIFVNARHQMSRDLNDLGNISAGQGLQMVIAKVHEHGRDGWKETVIGFDLINGDFDTSQIDIYIDEYLAIEADLGSSLGREVVNTHVEENLLSASIGKAMADQIRENPEQSGSIKGDSLKVTKTGFAQLYELTAASQMNRIAKELGSTTEVGEVGVLLPERGEGSFRNLIRLSELTPGQISVIDHHDDAHFLKERYLNNAGEWTDEEYFWSTREEAEEHRNRAILKKLSGDKQPGIQIDQSMRDAVIGSKIKLFSQPGPVEEPLAQYDPSTFTINLLKGANLSSVIHESGHFYLHALSQIAAQENASETVKEDFQTIMDWFGVSADEWYGMTVKEQTEYHEQFAESFELFTLEGKAPNIELQGAFTRFRQWLLSVYKDIENFLKTHPRARKLNDEVRAVFGRMMASEESIAEAEKIREYMPMFASAEESGTSEAKFKEYIDQHNEATQEAITDLTSRSIRDMKWLSNAQDKALKALQATANAERKVVREQVTEAVEKEDIYRAIAFLKTGKMTTETGEEIEATEGHKLNTQAVKDLGVDPLSLRGMTSTTGLDPQQVGEIFGFQHAGTFIQHLLDAPNKKEKIDALTDQRMVEEHSDLATEEDRKKAVDKAIHNKVRARMMATGLKMLTKSPLSVSQINKAAKEAAAARVAKMKVRDLRPGQYDRAEAKANKEALKLAAKDPVGAAARQQAALLNNHLAKAVREAIENVDKHINHVKKLEGKSTLKSLEAGYLEQIFDLLSPFRFKKGETLKAIDKKRTLAEWMDEQVLEFGFQPVLDTELIDSVKTMSYKEMTTGQLDGLMESVDHIEHLGRLKKKLLNARDKREFEIVATEMMQSIVDNSNRVVNDEATDESKAGQIKDAARALIAMHRKFSSLAREMDGGKDGGPMQQFFSRGMNEAGAEEAEMKGQATEVMANLFKMFELDVVPENLFNKMGIVPGTDLSMSQENRIMFALNWGNLGNRQRLLSGGLANNRAIDEDTAAKILDTLTKGEWDFVQGVLDYFETYREPMGALEKELTGMTPTWVEAEPIQTKFGTYRGGYFPAKYDAKLSVRSEMFEALNATRTSMQGAFGNAQTRDSAVQKRAEEVHNRPIKLTFSVITSHVGEVTHRLAWQRYLTDANRMLKALEPAIRRHYGPTIYKEMQDSLNDIAIGDVGSQNGIDTAFNHIRVGSTVVGMGWRVTTALLQPSGMFQSMARIGTKWSIVGLKRFMTNPMAANDFVNSMSPMMVTRASTMQREVSEVMNQVRGAKQLTNVKASAFVMIAKMQRLVDIPTWIGAYEKGLEQLGYDKANNEAERKKIEDTAASLGDQAVLDSQSGGQIKDLAKVQRLGPVIKTLTNFYSYFSATYNLNVENYRKTNFKSFAAIMEFASNVLLLNLFPVIYTVLLREALNRECEWEWDCLKHQYANEQISFILGQAVPVRELTVSATSLYNQATDQPDYFKWSGPAGMRLFSDTSKLGKQLGQAIEDEGETDVAFWKAAANVAGIALHLPLGQVSETAEGIWSLYTGDTDPSDAVPVLLVGPPYKR